MQYTIHTKCTFNWSFRAGMFSYHTTCHESDDQMKGHANAGMPTHRRAEAQEVIVCAALITRDNTVSSSPAARNEGVVLGTWDDGGSCRCLLYSLSMRGLGVGGVAASLKTTTRKGPGMDQLVPSSMGLFWR